MRDCRKAIELCTSLHTFRCTESNVFPAFLMALQQKPNLQSIRINGNLTTEQTKLLVNMTALSEVMLEYSSWNLVDALPRWTETLRRTLNTLVLYVCAILPFALSGIAYSVLGIQKRTDHLSEGTLESVLKELPELSGLHVIQCPHVDHVVVLGLVSHTPELESLSFTTLEKSRPLVTPLPDLPCLRHLAVDARYHMSPSPTPTILVTLLEHLKISAPGISSFTMKLSERKITIVPSFINRLIEVYGSYLKKVAFLDCSLENESIKKLSQKCPHLERLDVSIPIREAYSFGDLLSPAKHLTTLVDVDTHTQHGIRPSLSFDVVQTLMQKVPSLKTLVSDRRVWVAELDEDMILTPKLDRRLPLRSRASWFLPSHISSS
ncbi:hypothetical protein EST38_g11281 [Candolleomyces aberdarensis]|uniref:F-box protein n=1 Tax=Candolleomyces aberdarensis TaxID=2316362 RepID=A0A4Q2D7L1_9AGAR|nr:hypothetical protein EST38_g11281 [Candolleomyces aberdarensis]